MYSVSIRNIEKRAVPRMKPATFAPRTVFVRRIPNRISGSATRFSQATKPSEQSAREDEDADRAGGAPTPVVALRDGEHERGEAGR